MMKCVANEILRKRFMVTRDKLADVWRCKTNTFTFILNVRNFNISR